MYSDGFALPPADRVKLECQVPEEKTVQRDQRVALDPLVSSDRLDLLERRYQLFNKDTRIQDYMTGS